MTLKAELKRLRALALERTEQYPAGWWTWEACPEGSNYGYFKKKGAEEYSLEVPKGGKAIKIQYVDSGGRAERIIEGASIEDAPLTPPTEAEAIACAANLPQQILDELGNTRAELEGLLLFDLEITTSDDDSEAILARSLTDWADQDEGTRTELVRKVDFKRGRKPAPSDPLRKESDSIVKTAPSLAERVLPSAVQMVRDIIEKREEPEPEKEPTYIELDPERARVRKRNLAKEERIKQNNERWNAMTLGEQLEAHSGWE